VAVSKRLAWTVAVVGAATMTVSYVDRQTFAVLAKTVGEELHLSETEFGWLSSAFSIAYLFAVPISGWWIDRAGARRGLALSVLMWSVVAALHALVPGFAALFMLRIALGVAEAPSFPGAAQTMQRMLPSARGYALLFTGSSIGASVAPLLASWLFGVTHSWRAAFLGTAIAGLSWLPVWWLVTARGEVKEELETVAQREGGEGLAALIAVVRRPDVIRGLLAVLAVAPAIGFGFNWGAKHLGKAFDVHQEDVGHYLWLPPLCLDAGALLFGDLTARLRRPRLLVAIAAVMASSLVQLPSAGSPWLATAVLACTLAGGGGINTMATAELLGRTVREKVAVTAGVLTAAQSIALIIANPLMGMASDATGDYGAAAIGCAVWVIPGVAGWLAWPRRS
jgi:ACS family hexuronate transporter-like MFS transporter